MAARPLSLALLACAVRAAAAAGLPPMAGTTVFLAGGSQVWCLCDLNADGDYLDYGEVRLYAQPTGSPPTAITASPLGLFLLRSRVPSGAELILLRDLNGDGDALDAGETTTWLSSATAFTRLAADEAGPVWLTDDTSRQLWRAVDWTGDEYFGDPGEVLPVAQFATTPTAVAPRGDGRLIVTATDAAAPVRTLEDRNADADFLDFAENLSYIEGGPLAAGIAVADPATAFVLSAADRLTILLVNDWTGDGDALDRDEVLTFATAPASVDAIAMLSPGPPPTLLALRTLSGQLFAIRDLNGDGDALDSSEVLVVAAALPSAQFLAVAPAAAAPCLAGDLDGDGAVTAADATPFVALLLDPPADVRPCPEDLNGDGLLDGQDIPPFLAALL